MKRTFLLLSFFVTVALPGFSQSQLGDSLYSLLKKYPQADTVRVNWLNELSEHIELMPSRSDSLSRQALLLSRRLHYVPGEVTALGLFSSAQARMKNVEQALVLAEQGREIAIKSNNPRLIARALWRLAFVYRYQTKYQKALATNRQALKHAWNIQSKSLESKIFNEIGLAFRMKGDSDEAMRYFQQSLNTLPTRLSLKNQSFKIDLLHNMASLHNSEGDLVSAAEYALQALDVSRQAKDYYRATFIYILLSTIYNSLEEPLQALAYGQQALREAERFGELKTIDGILNSIGSSYAMLGQYPEAIAYYQRSLKIVQQLNNQFRIVARQASLADAYELQGSYKTAFKFAHQSLVKATTLGDQTGVGRVMNILARVHLHTGQLDSSRWYGERSLELAKKAGYKLNAKETYKVLSQVYAQQHDTAKAYRYQLLYSIYTDSAYRAQAESRLTILQYQLDIGKKQSEIELLLESNQLKSEASRRQQQLLFSLFMGLALALLLAGVLWRTNQQKQKNNAELLKLNKEVANQRDSLNSTLTVLKSTQEQLVQKEKMASLGELTAGIAHEIQNPLNFVNNFSEVSIELMDELKQRHIQRFNNEDKVETELLLQDLSQNLARIHQHGKRADAIVKSMLQHSLKSNGVKEQVDINALADEYLHLAYHGLRVNDKEFNAKLQTDFDEDISKVEVVPQELGQVLLNVFNNAFYAVRQKKHQLNGQYQPEVKVSTRQINKGIEVKVKDNGTGIAQNVMKKIFQPFFTTKPSGQGTGLGLSLSYDIITKGHSGEILVDSQKGEYTEILIRLPINE